MNKVKRHDKHKIERIKVKIIDLMLAGEAIVVSYNGGEQFFMHKMPRDLRQASIDQMKKIFMWSDSEWPSVIRETAYPSITALTLEEAMRLIEENWDHRIHMGPK